MQNNAIGTAASGIVADAAAVHTFYFNVNSDICPPCLLL